MEDLTEVITSAEFHPHHCHVFAYSSSKGCIRLADMRGAALCEGHAKAYQEADQHTVRGRGGGGGVEWLRGGAAGGGQRGCGQ